MAVSVKPSDATKLLNAVLSVAMAWASGGTKVLVMVVFLNDDGSPLMPVMMVVASLLTPEVAMPSRCCLPSASVVIVM